MGARICTKCGELRAPRDDTVCKVCYLVNALAEEHAAGEHTTPNASCIACTRDPEYVAMLQRETRAMKAAEQRQTRREIHEGVRTPVTRAEKKIAQSKPRGSHADCDHDSTPKARSKCRAARRRLA